MATTIDCQQRGHWNRFGFDQQHTPEGNVQRKTKDGTERDVSRARAKNARNAHGQRVERREQVQRTSERFGAQWPTDTIDDDYGPVRSGRVSVSTVRLGCLRPSPSFLSFFSASFVPLFHSLTL